MTNTDRVSTGFQTTGESCLNALGLYEDFAIKIVSDPRPFQSISNRNTCQGFLRSSSSRKLFPITFDDRTEAIATKSALSQRTPDRHEGTEEEESFGRNRPRKSLRLTLVNDGIDRLPAELINSVLEIDQEAQMKKSWASAFDTLTPDFRNIPDVLVVASKNFKTVFKHINELWQLRESHNHSPRPIYFGIAQEKQPPIIRFQLTRMGAHFLHLFDVVAQFKEEIEQIRLELQAVVSSRIFWRIVLEGNGESVCPRVSFAWRGDFVPVEASDRVIAALAAFIMHSGIPRSIKEWLVQFENDTTFMPLGGRFPVPSESTFKMYLGRDFINCLQKAFDEYRSGFCAKEVIECINPGTHAAKYRIRGEWEPIRW